MKMMSADKIKAQFALSRAKTQAHLLESEGITLPADPIAVLDEWEREVKKWQDHPKLPQKARVLREIDFARQAVEDGDDTALRLEFFYMIRNAENYHSDVWTVKKEEDEEKFRTGGATGGSNDKRSKWAIAAAEWLVEKYGYKLKKQDHYTDKLPESFEPLTVEYEDDEWEVWRDGGKVYAQNLHSRKTYASNRHAQKAQAPNQRVREPDSLTYETFRKEYISRAQKRGSNPP